MIHRKKSW